MPDAGNTLPTATALHLGWNLQPIADSVGTINDSDDYYRFRLSGRTSVGLSLTGLNGNVDLQLLTSSGSVIQQSTNPSSTAEMVSSILDAGTYYIQVRPGNGQTTAVNYSLDVKTQTHTQSDILWRGSGGQVSGRNIVWEMNGATFTNEVQLLTVSDLNWKMQATADFNGDGQTDIFWRNYATGVNAVWLMNGTSYASSAILETVTDLNWKLQGAADFDDDGQVDLLWRNYGAGSDQGVTALWLMNGTTIRTTVTIHTEADLNWVIPGIGDFNGDGKPDIVWQNVSTGQTGLWLMNGTSYVSNTTFNHVPSPNWKLLGTGDFNNDSKPDLFWRDASTGQNGVWLMNGTNITSTFYIANQPDLNWQPIAPLTQYLQPDAIDLAGNTAITAFNVGTLNSNAIYHDQLSNTDSEDYYQFSISTAKNFSLSLSGLIGDANVQILNSNGVVVQSSTTTSTTAEFIHRFLDVGTYYIRVYSATSGINTNYTLNFAPDGPLTLSEGNKFLVQQSIPIELGEVQGSRTLSFDLTSYFDSTDSTSITEDRFLVYLINPNQPNQTLLDNGLSGTAIFSLSKNKAEYRPGQVRYDGSKVTIDLSDIKSQPVGSLLFQLINNDADSGTWIQIQNLANTVDLTGSQSPVFPIQSQLVQQDTAISNLNTLSPTSNLEMVLSNIRVDASTGKYTAALQVRNIGLSATGQTVVVVFPNLPTGVQLLNPSGVNSSGAPYINLQTAIQGGLASGDISAPVEISFSNPNLIKFDLHSTILAGGINHAPTLGAINAQTLKPGAYLEIPLAAADLDGDTLTYFIQTDGTQPVPPCTVTSDGKLIFRPSPEQLNQTFNFFVVVSDGVVQTKQAVTLSVVPDAVTTTRISGIVRSATANPQALAGIQVEWGSVQTTTAADGSFTLAFTGTLPTTALKVNGKQAAIPNTSYPDVLANVEQLLGYTPYSGYNNVLSQPIFLTAIDTSNVKQIDAAVNSTLTNSTLPDTLINIPQGALIDAQTNLPYTGSVSLTKVNSNQLPVPLPDGLSAMGIIAVDLGNATCVAPLPIQAPNPTSYQGPVDLWGLTANGQWTVVGSGITVSNGASSYFRAGQFSGGSSSGSGISGSGLYFFAPTPLTPKAFAEIDLNPDEACESCKVRKRFNSDATVELHSGTVMESHDLLSYQSLGVTRGLRLQYDSLRADPRPILHFGYDNVKYDALNNDKYRMIAKLDIELANGSTYEVPGFQGQAYGLTGGEHFWKIPAPQSGTSVSVDGALQADMRHFASGVYDYNLISGIKVLCNCGSNDLHFLGGSTKQTDKLVVVNSINSAFGSGWGLAGLQELIENRDGSILLIDGDGSQSVFKNLGGYYQSSAGDFSTLTKLLDGTFQRTTKDGTVYSFNAQNKLQTVVDRNGLTTSYNYNAGTGQLESIVDPAGAITTFYYDATTGKVRYIKDPANRTTELRYDSAGNLIEVVDPDQTSRRWTYDSEHHLATTTDKLGTSGESGHVAQTFYDFAGRATYAVDKDGAIVRVNPVQVQGLRKPYETVDPFINVPIAQVAHPASADYVDANGNVTQTRLDRAQQEIFSKDAIGPSATLEHSNTGQQKYLVTKSTDARGHTTTYSYDSRGNVITVQDELSQGVPATDTLFAQPIYRVNPQAVAVDWDNNGTLDFVNPDGTIAFGDGRGGFSAPAEISVNTSSGFVTVGDLNGDGHLDIVTADGWSTLQVRLQQANGTFQISNLDIGEHSYVEAIGLADLDGDEDLDLFSLNGMGYGGETADNHVAVWLNNGGHFDTSSVKKTLLNERPTAINFGDMNGDGIVDLVVSDGSKVSLLLAQKSTAGKGTGSFTVSTLQTGGNQAQAALGDVNGDNRTDIALLSGNDVVIYFGQPDGSLGNASLPIPTGLTSPSTVFLKDMNGDGNLDLVAASFASSNNIAILLGQGNGTFEVAKFYSLQWGTLKIGNFNTQVEIPMQPGKLDLLSISSSSYWYSSTSVAALFNQGDGTLVARPTSTSTNADVNVGTSPVAAVTADLDGDRDPDVLTANAGDQSVSINFNNGDGTFATTHYSLSMSSSPWALAVGDVDGDGKLDFVTANSDGSLSIGINSSQGGQGTFQAETRIANVFSAAAPTSIALADVNGDGKLDIVSTNSGTTHNVSVLLGNGNGTFDLRSDFTVGSNPRALVVADFNGDSYLDIATANGSSNTLSVLLGNGSGSFTLSGNYTTGSQPISLAVGDVNQDGKLDLVVANSDSSTGNSVSVLKGLGNGTFEPKVDYVVGDKPSAVSLGDVNQDGRLDIVVANYWGSSVSVLLGSPEVPGRFAVQDRFDFRVNSNAIALALADFNQDKALDFAVVAGNSLSIRLNDLLQIGTPIGKGHHDYVYDPIFNQLTRETDALGRVTTYSLDEHGNVSRMTRVVGTEDSPTQIVDDVVTTYTYTTDGRVKTITDPNGHITEYNYDYDSNTNRFKNLRQITFAKGTADEATQTFEYDAAGNQSAVIDERGNRTEYHYDLNTNWLSEMVQADPDGPGPLTSPRTQYTYDANGRQITVQDARGVAQGYVTQTNNYDALGRLRQTTGADPDGSGPLLAPVTTYTYDLNGNMVSMVDALNQETKYRYDERNRLIETIHPDLTVTQQRYDADNNSVGSVNAKGQKTQTVLDARGRRVAEIDALGNLTRFVYDVADQLVAQIDALGQVTRFVYDDLGRQVQVIDALGQVSQTTYDKNGNVIAQMDALGHQTQYGFDARDRQTTVTDALNQVTTTTYDKVGNVLTIKDPALNTTSYTYDGLNRLLTDTNQLGATRTYGYDANGNQTSVIDRNGLTRTFTFDRLNRQTQENWLNASGSSIRAITSTYNVGSQLTGLSDPDSSYQYTYDLNGRLKTIDNLGTPGVARVVLTYGYDDNGNLKSVVDTINGQAGGTTSYEFDPLDRVSQINQSGPGVQNKRVNFTYNALGQMATLNRYSDLGGTQLVAGTAYTYDALNRLQQLSHKKADGSNLATYTYGYDAASRITSLGSQFANAAYNDTSTYSYDNTNQLAAADHSAISDEGYTYDANGNRTNAGYQTGTNNQLSSDGTYNYTYDAEGNLKTRTEIATGKVREFTWDYRNRLSGVTDKTGGTVTQQVSYTYDALNQRIAKTVGAQTTRFVYDQGNVYLEFSGTSTTPSTRYLHGPMVDQVLAQESNSQTTWMLTDHLGSVRDLVNNSGVVVNHFTYDSFGQVIGSMAGATTDTRYKFTGREYDGETGLYYYRARYFDAKVGRFIGQDPIGFRAGDSNLYRYVGNSPLNATDPSGLLVRGVVNRTTNQLTLTDLDGRSPSITVTIFSGNNEYKNRPEFEFVKANGPIPKGTYEIFNDVYHASEGWYRLDRVDSKPRNDKDDDLYKRDGFRLHPGIRSLGCVTIPEENKSDWARIKEMLNRTSTQKAWDNSGLREHVNQLLHGPSLTKYGEIVVDTPSPPYPIPVYSPEDLWLRPSL